MKTYENTVRNVGEKIAYQMHHRYLNGIDHTHGTGVSGAAIAIGEQYEKHPMKVRDDLRAWTDAWFRAIDLDYQISKRHEHTKMSLAG